VRLPSLREFAKQRSSVQPGRRSFIPLVALAVVAWVLEMLDGVTGVLMMQRQGYASELNPLVRGAFHDYGPLVLLLKLGPATIVLLAFLGLARRRPVLARNVLVAAIALGAIGVWSNL
jgi:hypothetical protein